MSSSNFNDASNWLGTDKRKLALGIAAVLFAGLAITGALLPEKAPEPPKVTAASVDVPIYMHTNGGRLEVATVTATQDFKLEAAKREFLGVDLGRTVSSVRVKAVYRFHIDMEKKWPIQITQDGARVMAGPLKSTLPVSFDTRTLETETQSGWARFDKHENLKALERQLSPELEKLAEQYKKMALDSARTSIADFVRTWMLKEHHWQKSDKQEIEVLFPGEQPKKS
ncbi:hypothetical protein [Inhella gelatinilytica]|uniref:DUF4230 domain-containing protein n=1 Tax=Inhella gelatinilytica TaxID=2795030 RepID=A0A931J252_9BURK|nr:hypothetical protein [Inhella gelatinilytica]MBH9553966.1 hypothetical protein [Inhella gelatinilytica]